VYPFVVVPFPYSSIPLPTPGSVTARSQGCLSGQDKIMSGNSSGVR